MVRGRVRLREPAYLVDTLSTNCRVLVVAGFASVCSAVSREPELRFVPASCVFIFLSVNSLRYVLHFALNCFVFVFSICQRLASDAVTLIELQVALLFEFGNSWGSHKCQEITSFEGLKSLICIASLCLLISNSFIVFS